MQQQQEAPRYAAPAGGNPIEPEMNPGDQPPPGRPDTGENSCPNCDGSGVRDDGARCEHCGGTGKVTEGPGGL